jgi:hypothetical protein
MASSIEISTFWPRFVRCRASSASVIRAGRHPATRSAMDAAPHGRAAGLAGDRHHAAECLHHGLVAAIVGARPSPPERRDRAVDETWLDLGQRFIAEAERLHGAGPEVLQHHVALAGQALEQLAALGSLQIHRDALLAAVDRHEVRRFAAQERRPRARVVALARLLDLDDLGAHVTEDHRAERPGQHPREIQHAYSG